KYLTSRSLVLYTKESVLLFLVGRFQLSIFNFLFVLMYLPLKIIPDENNELIWMGRAILISFVRVRYQIH
ncbi:hypothetical protein, partial [Chryseobacterium indologenes]